MCEEALLACRWAGEKAKHSPHHKIMTADALRIVILYRWGGVYFDDDFIHIRFILDPSSA